MQKILLAAVVLLSANACFAQQQKKIGHGNYVTLETSADSSYVEDPVTGERKLITREREGFAKLNGMNIYWEDFDNRIAGPRVDSILAIIFTDTDYVDEVERILIDTTGRIVYYNYYIRFAPKKSKREQAKHMRITRRKLEEAFTSARFEPLYMKERKVPYFVNNKY